MTYLELMLQLPKELQEMSDRYHAPGNFRWTSREAAVRLATRSPGYYLNWKPEWGEDILCYDYRDMAVIRGRIDVARLEEYYVENAHGPKS